MAGLTLDRMAETFAIARLDADAAVPGWAEGPGFTSVTRTVAELSVMCPQCRVPEGTRAERDWAGYRFAGTFDFGPTVIAAAALAPLAAAGVPILMIATFDTDYLFVKSTDRARAEDALRSAGLSIT